MNKTILHTKHILLGLASILSLASCDTDMGSTEVAFQPYVLSLGITSSGTTTYYVVTAEDLADSTQTIDALGKGIEQSGYRDYQQAGQTLFSIGGLGVTSATGIQRDDEGFIQEKGNFVFTTTPIGFCQVDDNTMAAMELPTSTNKGGHLTFYSVDIQTLSLDNKITTTTVAPMDDHEWPYVTGMEYAGDKLYVSYEPMNPNTFTSDYADTSFVAVYSYPDCQFVKLMKDTRFGNIGSWNAFNGFQKDEQGDLYAMSNTSMANGFSQSPKHCGFLKIKAGDTEFDPDYTFDYQALTGQKVAHWLYLGNGKVFAEVTTRLDASAWSDADLKCCIIDLVNKTSIDVEGIPVHNGNGGRRYTCFYENGMVYTAIPTTSGVYIYQTDVASATATKGAKVSANFVAGIFKLN
ncbi:MAG: DUF4374 domain-containing protein [Prevotella sp.]|nr:DUF4374 domain-containing protein [Prevotella sp.]